jgi:ABC-type transport system involved in multi-copper enzyme maturation permease subunit
MNTILTIARLTFREAVRRKIVLAALLLGIAFLVIYDLGLYFIQKDLASTTFMRQSREVVQNQAFNMLTLAGMYVVNFLAVAIAALITADSLAGEIQSGTIQAVVTKPIRRAEVVVGKWLGHAGLLLLYLLLMGGGVVLSVWAMVRYAPPNWAAGIGLIYFNALIIMTLTLAFSSSLSTLATGGAVFGAFGLAFIGGWVERIGTFMQNRTAIDLGIFSSLLLPTEALWNKSAGLMSSPLLSMVGTTPFTSASQPSTVMIFYAVVYLAAALGLAVWSFGKRDL